MTVTDDPRTVPGGLELCLRREVAGGVIEFEFAPRGYLTQKGEPRKRDHRAYYWTPRGSAGRTRLAAVSTVLDSICPKPGLPPWAEARGIEGAVEAVRRGLIDLEHPGEPVRTVRANGLGADRARDEAATRGLNIHDCLRVYMETGDPPNPGDHPRHHHGFMRALMRWLLKADPEPTAIEQLVADPAAGYAGRLDLRARTYGALWTWDAKTQERLGLYPASHLQCGLYERAARVCGDEPADRLGVVVFAADGNFDEMPADHAPTLVDSALEFYRNIAPVNGQCESRNRQIREAMRDTA